MSGDFKHDLARSEAARSGRWVWWRVALLGSILTGSAGAADARPRPPPEFRQLAPLPAVAETARAGGVQLTGQEPLKGDRKMQPGDAVTVLVSLTKGEALQQWVFTFTMEEPTAAEKKRPHDTARVFTSTGHDFHFDGGRAGIRIAMIGPLERRDAGRKSASEVKRQRILVDADFLALGLERVPAMSLRMQARHKADPAAPSVNLDFGDNPYPPEVVAKIRAQAAAAGIVEADERAFIGSILALQEFLQLASRTPGMRDVFMSVLDVPWWSIILKGGKLNLNVNGLPFERELNAAEWGLPASEKAYASPFLLSINSKLALLFQLALVAPKPPLTVSAGIIGIAAGAPDGKGPVLTLQVVASHAASASPEL